MLSMIFWTAALRFEAFPEETTGFELVLLQQVGHRRGLGGRSAQ
jgi:hypothetical protein